MESITIVISAYNVSKYIERCICSCLNQTLPAYSIIVVDDASSDDTIKKVEDMAERNDIVKIIRKEINEGLYKSRLTGLVAVESEYVVFVDADDLLTPHAIESFERSIERNNPDIVRGCYEEIGMNGSRAIRSTVPYRRGSYYAKSAEIFPLGTMHIGSIFVNAIKVDFLRGCGLEKVNLTKNIGEDFIYNSTIISKARVINYIPDIVYFYIRREGSLTLESRGKRDYITEASTHLYASEALEEFYLSHSLFFLGNARYFCCLINDASLYLDDLEMSILVGNYRRMLDRGFGLAEAKLYYSCFLGHPPWVNVSEFVDLLMNDSSWKTIANFTNNEFA